MGRFNKLFTLALGVAFFAAASVRADSVDDVMEVPAPIDGVFIPQGFDTNDNSQVVISGAYPNTCYKMGNVTKSVDLEQDEDGNIIKRDVKINVTAYYHHSRACLMLYTPFTEVVSLGLLKKGAYEVQVNDVQELSLPVAEAPVDRSDNYVYANVFGLLRKGERLFEIQGTLPKTCALLEEVRVVEEEGSDVVVVLPIVAFPEGCDASEENFEDQGRNFIARFQTPANLKGKQLIHVRTLNGGSLNQVVEFK